MAETFAPEILLDTVAATFMTSTDGVDARRASSGYGVKRRHGRFRRVEICADEVASRRARLLELTRSQNMIATEGARLKSVARALGETVGRARVRCPRDVR
jgi:hypothetical protein